MFDRLSSIRHLGRVLLTLLVALGVLFACASPSEAQSKKKSKKPGTKKSSPTKPEGKTEKPDPNAKKPSSDAAAMQYNLAVGLLKEEQFKLAATEWEKFLKLYPMDPYADDATYLLGVSQYKAGNLDAAVAAYRQAVKFPKLSSLEEAYLNLGYVLYVQASKGKPELYKEAAASFAAQLEKFPMGKLAADATYFEGDCLFSAGQKAEAAKLFSTLIEKFPENPKVADSLYLLGLCHEDLKQYADAAKAYQAFLEKFKDNALANEIQMRLGESLYQTKQYDAALEHLKLAAEAPKFAQADYATMRMADVLVEQKKYGEAAALYESIPQKFKESRYAASVHLAAGTSYFLAKNYPKAREQLAFVVQKGGDNAPEAAHWIAQSLIREKKPGEVVAVVDPVLAKAAGSKWHTQLLVDKADALYDLAGKDAAKLTAAAAIYQEIVKDEKSPLAGQAAYMSALATYQADKPDAALKAVAEFLARFKGSDLEPDVLLIGAECNLKLKQYAEAEKGFQTLIEKYPQRAEASQWKIRGALALLLEKKYDEAVKSLKPIVAGLKSPAQQAEAQFLLGASLAQLKDYQAAATALEASLKADPKHSQAEEAMLIQAQCYQELKQTDAAIAILKKLVANPDSPVLDRAYFRLAECLSLAKDHAGAEAAYNQVLTRAPDGPLAAPALYSLCWALYSQGKHAEAIKAATQLIEKFPDSPRVAEVKYLRGLSRHALKQYAEAIADLQEYLKSKPSSEENLHTAQYVIGVCQSNQEKWSDALATFEALLKEAPKYKDRDKVLYELAWAKKGLDKGAEASATFAQLATEYPDSPYAGEAFFHVGESEYADEEYEKAIKSYGEAVKRAGKTRVGESAEHMLAWSYYQEEDYAKAQEAFAKQRADFPMGERAGDAMFMEAECLFKLDKFKESLDLYAKLPKLDKPKFLALAALHAAQAANALKEWKQGEALAAKAVKDFPESDLKPEMLYEHAWALKNLDKNDEAKTQFEEVTKIGGTREVAARARYMIGEILFIKNQLPEAITEFFKVKVGYNYPVWKAEATYEIGLIMEKQKDKAGAAKFYKEIIEQYPDSPKVELAKQRLKGLEESK